MLNILALSKGRRVSLSVCACMNACAGPSIKRLFWQTLWGVEVSFSTHYQTGSFSFSVSTPLTHGTHTTTHTVIHRCKVKPFYQGYYDHRLLIKTLRVSYGNHSQSSQLLCLLLFDTTCVKSETWKYVTLQLRHPWVLSQCNFQMQHQRVW